MSADIDIRARHLQIVVSLLNRHLPDTTVWAYGSRVKRAARRHSDLDLVAFTDAAQDIALFDVKEAFEESDLPFRVDIFRWDDLPPSFQRNIEQHYAIVQEKSG